MSINKTNTSSETIVNKFDYIPFISFVSNITLLFFKAILTPINFISGDKLSSVPTFKYIQDRSSLRSLALLVPIIGNIGVYLHDDYKKIQNENSEIATELTQNGVSEVIKNRILAAHKEKSAINSFKRFFSSRTVKLDLSNQGLSSLPSAIGKLENLRFLNLSGNQLTALPQEIENLKELRSLNISNNSFQNLAPSVNNNGLDKIGNLAKLRHLNISKTGISHLPNSFKNLTQLLHIDHDVNQVKNAPSELLPLLLATDRRNENKPT